MITAPFSHYNQSLQDILSNKNQTASQRIAAEVIIEYF